MVGAAPSVLLALIEWTADPLMFLLLTSRRIIGFTPNHWTFGVHSVDCGTPIRVSGYILLLEIPGSRWAWTSYLRISEEFFGDQIKYLGSADR